MEKTILIEGMSSTTARCTWRNPFPACGVQSARVDLKAKNAKVVLDAVVTDDALKDA
jgi:hypothetical protein